MYAWVYTSGGWSQAPSAASRPRVDGAAAGTMVLGKQFRRYGIKAPDVALYAQTNIFPKQSVRKSYKCLLHPLRQRTKICNYLLHGNEIATIDPPLRATARHSGRRGMAKTRRRLHPMNCVFHQLSRISFPFTLLIKLIRHGNFTWQFPFTWNNLTCFRYLIMKSAISLKEIYILRAFDYNISTEIN